MQDTSRPSGHAIQTSIPENDPFAQLHNDTAAVADAPDLRERVRDLTARVLHDRRMMVQDMGEIIRAVTAGVGSGLQTRGGEIKAGLKQAVLGLDDAFGSAALATSYTLREAVEQGRSFKEGELRSRLDALRAIEGQFIDTLQQTARQTRGVARQELEQLADHLKITGTRTGDQMRGALDQIASGIKHSAAVSQAALGEAASTAGERLSQAAGGVLEAVSDSLKRQSERLRS